MTTAPTPPAEATNLVPSLIRTYVPWLVGIVLAYAEAELDVTGIDPDMTTTVVVAIVSAVYYAAARRAEQARPGVGRWLLGHAGTPTYVTPSAEESSPELEGWFDAVIANDPTWPT